MLPLWTNSPSLNQQCNKHGGGNCLGYRKQTSVNFIRADGNVTKKSKSGEPVDFLHRVSPRVEMAQGICSQIA